MRDLERRIRQLERDMLPPAPGWPTIIQIRGGIPGEDGKHAAVGELRFRRRPGEDQAEFEGRVIEAAIEAGEPFVMIGGLPAFTCDN
jgi:hypothetical protein